ncbi:GNAT family N-acetyltransferase [Leisingera sp. NJS201]|uniref:GNAT family N-acetyltransferase n=1 Tax=Leisingera sp. NJS201 TaxID=2508306 RepID=UPI001070AD36|nr:GNAT family N-acetyltransferase [Leisingera sp. NJS201]QBR34873.1 GNAT family N-acetyltransferase [Leisingera sp. NJS201]
MSGPVLVRPARWRERFGVLKLARDFHAAAGIPFPFNPAHASQAAQRFIEDPDKLCLVLEVSGVLRGVLAASWSISPLAPVRLAQEVIFWVDPQHRGSAARRMLAAYEDWARNQRCDAAGLAALNDPRVARFFGAAGFKPVEAKFLKILG